jgi:hypothetical protein
MEAGEDSLEMQVMTCWVTLCVKYATDIARKMNK